MTNALRSKLARRAGFTLLSVASTASAQSATIDWTDVHQEIDGFGASNAYASAPLTSAQAEFFFGTAPGDIGLSLLRTEVPDDGSCTTVSATCEGNVGDMKAAIAHGARIWSTPWSPPASMKTNASTTCTGGAGNGALATASYAAYASYLSNYVASLKSLDGIDLYALSVQNEPDNCPTYDGARWSASDFDVFIKNDLGPKLASAGQSSTLLIMPESSQFASFASEANATMTDSTAAAFVGINAWHDYDDAPSVANPYASAGKKYWETEASAGKGFGPSLCTQPCYDPSIADALMWASIVDDRLAVADVNAWHYWWLIDYGKTPDNESLALPTGTAAKRAYMLGNYSMFVRPGYRRIDATHAPQTGVTVSAYQDKANGSLVIVATNQGTASVSQAFDITNGPPFTTVTPWITSASSNLASQADVPVSSNAFTYSLPASSVTTFVGSSSSNPPDGGVSDAGKSDGGSRDSGPSDGALGDGAFSSADASPSAGVDAASGGGDANSDASPSGKGGSGCGCHVASTRDRGQLGALFALALAAASLVRRRGSPTMSQRVRRTPPRR